ncbi:hypothetical protein [Mycobacterium sp. IEC1808]|uniref:hypothetical protein n=1 Tax=Mycobacterium sp. IEC1808 TaxID=1743230 RepID=UPI00114F0ADB|nr:hypothetical protein [Mycobacterium sp. IEC1808]
MASQTHIVRKRLAETVVQTRRLGRHIEHDPRSRDFPAERAQAIVSVDHRATGLPLDQGQIGSCTANALCGALNSAPDYTGAKSYTESDAVMLYELETKLEGQPYPPNDPGGSGLMVCKAAQQLGWISSYRHAFGLQHALTALVIQPVITGFNWYTSFDEPDPDTGLVTITDDATVRGGHEVVVDGIDADNQLIWLWNSWGTNFGRSGRFCMSFGTWEQLLAESGDVTVPVTASQTPATSHKTRQERGNQ